MQTAPGLYILKGMKIEKLNENQIKATLTREDLDGRNIGLAEFAYGTESARQLFNDLLRFASYKLGFDTDDSPLMVEAVPISGDSLVILVTKVPYPDELDTRFARFSDAPSGDGYMEIEDEDYLPDEILLSGRQRKATDILDVTPAAEGSADKAASSDTAGADSEAPASDKGEDTSKAAKVPPERYTRLFCIDSIDDLLAAARVLAGWYRGENTVYHTRRGYELVVHIGNHTAEEFNRVINILSEYGGETLVTDGSEDYFAEHARPLVSHQALQVLSAV